MHGNSRTNPNGIEIDELPFNRMRRRKNDNPGSAGAFSLLISSRDGEWGDEGIRLTRPCRKPMTAKGSLPIRKLFSPAACRDAAAVQKGLTFATQSESQIFCGDGCDVLEGDLEIPKVREEITSDLGRIRYSQQQLTGSCMEEVGFEMLECEEGWRRRASGGRDELWWRLSMCF
jgi:hypothetical protein